MTPPQSFDDFQFVPSLDFTERETEAQSTDGVSGCHSTRVCPASVLKRQRGFLEERGGAWRARRKIEGGAGVGGEPEYQGAHGLGPKEPEIQTQLCTIMAKRHGPSSVSMVTRQELGPISW